MKYNRLHTAFLVVSLAFIGLMVDSCKSKKQEIPPFIDVHLEVKDANNVPSTGATAYLYNSEEAFQTAYQNSLNLMYNSTGSILTTTIVNGTVDLKGLPSNTEYWILVHDTSDFFRENGVIVPGYKVDKDNSEAYYKIDGFQNGTTVLANITLQPVTSLIKFGNNSGVGSFIRLEVGKEVLSNLPNNGYKEVRKGDTPYMARTNQCVWTGAVDAVGGQVVSESLVACNYREITFDAPFITTAGEQLDIYIGQNKSEPMLKLTVSKKTNSIIVPIANDYTFFAEYSVGGQRRCVYEGLIGSRTLITLDPCN